MKCNCEECGGTGTIECPECNGVGEWEGNIETIKLEKTMHNYAELKALKQDANRCKRQAERLTEMNPDRKDSYAAQLKGCLFVINGQAEKAAKRK